MKVGVIGSGLVAQTLAGGFLKHGYETMIGTRDVSQLEEWHTLNPAATVGSVDETAAFADLIVLAVKGTASATVLRAIGEVNIAKKIIIDATNPIADAPPVDGVLQFFTDINMSLMEQLQSEFPSAHWVKAFSSVGNGQFVNPVYKVGRPTMFICGNDENSKSTVTSILDQFGWETADMGTSKSARAVEPLCMLWCIPGFLHNQWTHAFKLLRTAQ